MTDDEADDSDFKFSDLMNLRNEEKTRIIKIWEISEFLRRKLKRIQIRHSVLF